MASSEDSALLHWAQSFDRVSGSTDGWAELCDGVALFEICADFAPDTFDTSIVKLHVADNERLRVSNVRKLVDCLIDYYEQELGYADASLDLDLPDVTAIGNKKDKSEAIKLVKLVLAAAVFSPRKEVYISNILQMQSSVQMALMTVIQSLMNDHERLAPAGGDDNRIQRMSSFDGSQSAVEHAEILALREENLRLKEELSDLNNTVHVLLVDKETLTTKLSALTDIDDPTTVVGHAQSALKDDVRQLQQALDAREDELMQLKDHVNKLETANESAKRAVWRLEVSAAEEEVAQVRRLQDERDSLRHNEERVRRLENALKVYSKQVEELPDIKERLRLAEEANAVYIEEKFELEERLRRLKERHVDNSGESGLSDEILTALTVTRQDAEDANHLVESLEAEKQSLLDTLNGYKNKIDELELDLQRAGGGGFSDSLTDISSSLAVELGGDKGVVVRLERELLLLRKRNERLIHEKEAADKRVTGLLSGGAAGAGVAAGEVAIVHERLHQTQQQLSDVTEKYNRLLADGGGSSSKEREYLQQINKLLVEKSALFGANTQWEKDVKFLTEELNDTREKLDQAHQYLQQGSGAENMTYVQKLKKELMDKENAITQLKAQQANQQAKFMTEQRLITTAWYNMGVRMQEAGLVEHLPGASTATAATPSFLRQQRKLSATRFTMRSQQAALQVPPQSVSPAPQQI